jgi:hypothetical protein
MPFEGQIQRAPCLKEGLVWAISVGGKGNGLMKYDWTGVGEVQRAEALAVPAGATEVNADKDPVSLAHGRTRSQLLQTAGHPEMDQSR